MISEHVERSQGLMSLKSIAENLARRSKMASNRPLASAAEFSTRLSALATAAALAAPAQLLPQQNKQPLSIHADSEVELVLQVVQSAARNLADRGDHRIISPVEHSGQAAARPVKIGLFGNLANQAYITARALRKLGHDVEVVVQENNIDAYPMSRPLWEECAVEIPDVSKLEIGEAQHYRAPDFVRGVDYDMDVQIKYQTRLSAVTEVIELYKARTGKTLARDEALVLAQWMGHWPYISAMHDYDVVLLSMWPICLGQFCSKPYVVCPLGGDLYTSSFEQDVQGLMFRAGFRGASHIAVAETDYPAYIQRLEARAPQTFMPLVVDTDVYHDGPSEALRQQWISRSGGDRFILGVCRQSWEWKGSDRLIAGFSKFFKSGNSEWRLLLQSWGDDLQRSQSMVTDLGLDAVTLWLPMCSKPLLRERQRAADVVADQFVMEGYGASVLESLAAGKPVVMSGVPAHATAFFKHGAPPLVSARSDMDIAQAFKSLADDAVRKSIGRKSREWVLNEHGYTSLASRFVGLMEEAAGRLLPGQAPRGTPSTRLRPQEFQDMWSTRRDEIRRQWNRVQPLAETLTDRWEKARYLGFGEGASIYDSALVIGTVTVGERTWIGPNCVLDGSGSLSIGKTCSVSAGCQLYSHDTVEWAVSGGTSDYKHGVTRVGDHVYLGPGVVVAAGTVIGDRSIVGAQSFVSGDIPPNSFAVGTPAKVIGRVEVQSDGAVRIKRFRDPASPSQPTAKEGQ
jgi:acetyltransferase-like isoleucine patch superfamily enzyme/glycosyltransferase involved in cell wall biosynthesis